MNDHGRPIEILLVEDNEGDIYLTQETLAESRMRNNLHIVRDGVEALAFLRKQGAYKDACAPDLILLDLNLPKKDGREVLEEIKTDEMLQKVPVVILTTSKDEADILTTYSMHANCYIVKPVDLDRFGKVVRSIESFWLTVVRLPPDDNAC